MVSGFDISIKTNIKQYNIAHASDSDTVICTCILQRQLLYTKKDKRRLGHIEISKVKPKLQNFKAAFIFLYLITATTSSSDSRCWLFEIVNFLLTDPELIA